MKQPQASLKKRSATEIIMDHLGPLLHLHFSNRHAGNSVLLQQLKLSKQDLTMEFRGLCKDERYLSHLRKRGKTHTQFSVDSRPTNTDSQAISAAEFMQKLLFIAGFYLGFHQLTQPEPLTYMKQGREVIYGTAFPTLQRIVTTPEEYASKSLVFKTLTADTNFLFFVTQHAAAIEKLYGILFKSTPTDQLSAEESDAAPTQAPPRAKCQLFTIDMPSTSQHGPQTGVINQPKTPRTKLFSPPEQPGPKARPQEQIEIVYV